MKVSVQAEDFDLSFEVKRISSEKTVGAVASFVGVVREVPMTLEHYPGMTENAIRKIVDTYLVIREQQERFLDTYRRVGIEPFKAAVYGEESRAA